MQVLTTFFLVLRAKTKKIFTMPSKRKAAALEAMRQRLQGIYRSSIDDYEVKDEGEVYEVIISET